MSDLSAIWSKLGDSVAVRYPNFKLARFALLISGYNRKKMYVQHMYLLICSFVNWVTGLEAQTWTQPEFHFGLKFQSKALPELEQARPSIHFWLGQTARNLGLARLKLHSCCNLYDKSSLWSQSNGNYNGEQMSPTRPEMQLKWIKTH